MNETTYEGDPLVVRVIIWADAQKTTRRDLTGATFEAAVGRQGGTVAPGTVTPVDLVQGEVDVAFPSSAVTLNTRAAALTAQLRVALPGRPSETGWSKVYTVLPSIRVS